MGRAVTLFTGQWADLSFEVICEKAARFGYDGLELACWGDHMDVYAASDEQQGMEYCASRWDILRKYGLVCYAISNHLVGQAILDNIDARHKTILPDEVWGNGDPKEVAVRAAQHMIKAAIAARNMYDAAPDEVKDTWPKRSNGTPRIVVNGFTGSSIWHLLYSFPPVLPGQIDAGYALFKERFTLVLDSFQKIGVVFALEVHPTEIAFDIASAKRALKAVDNHPAFGFNYDPSHLGYQGVDYIKFIHEFGNRIFHVHMKDVHWSKTPTEAGVFGGHTEFGNPERFWDFRSLGHGSVDFEEIIRALNHVRYNGPLSIEWEDGGMEREHGATEACAFTRNADFTPSTIAFDAQFAKGAATVESNAVVPAEALPTV